MTKPKGPRTPKPPRTYICRFCQYVFKRSEHLARHERSHTQEKPFGCSVCTCMFSRKDLVVRHERMIHFERKSTTRMTSRKAQKYEPRPQSQSSDNQNAEDTLSDEQPEITQLVTKPVIDADVAKRTAAEALNTDILQTLPSLFDEHPTPITPNSAKRRASHHEDERPTKLQILDDSLTSPSNIAPIAPMFGRSIISPSALLRETPRTAPDITAAVFPGFAIDPLLQQSAYEAQLDDEAAEESLRMFTNAEQQLVSPPLSLEDGENNKEERDEEDADRGNEDFLRIAAAEAWKLQLEDGVKVTS